MATNGTNHHEAVIGSPSNFWLYNSTTGFDLTRPTDPDQTTDTPRLTINTTTSPITVDPAKSALIVVDMQNYFLSPALGRAKGAGHAATDQLVQHAIPACRKAGIRLCWLNWGLTDEEIAEMPPAIIRAFGFAAKIDGKEVALDKHGADKAKHGGLGGEMGVVEDPETKQEIEAGKVLMRDQWNSALYPPLDKLYDEGKTLSLRPDVWIHKNRMSGMWGSSTACQEFLDREGIRTLLFTGVNTDQCVGGTLQDSFSKGYDCVMLRDGCGTTSPEFAQRNMEFNGANTFGFVASCKDLAEGVEKMKS